MIQGALKCWTAPLDKAWESVLPLHSIVGAEVAGEVGAAQRRLQLLSKKPAKEILKKQRSHS